VNELNNLRRRTPNLFFDFHCDLCANLMLTVTYLLSKEHHGCTKATKFTGRWLALVIDFLPPPG
jgi:hypothetical protein